MFIQLTAAYPEAPCHIRADRVVALAEIDGGTRVLLGTEFIDVKQSQTDILAMLLPTEVTQWGCSLCGKFSDKWTFCCGEPMEGIA